MAGFDLETQRTVQLIGGKINFGVFEFSSGSTTCEVPTTLSRALSGLASADLTDVNDTQQTLFAFKIGDVSNAAIMFVRAGTFKGEDARMSYWLAGY
jgi:hypothetical protein